MLIDAHTMVFDSAERLGLRGGAAARRAGVDGSPRRFDQAMEQVETALVLGVDSPFAGAVIGMEAVARVVRSRPGKTVGLAGIDPLRRDVASALQDASALGLKGVVVSPSGGDFHPAHSRAMRLYELCEAQGRPVVVLPGWELSAASRLEFAQPTLLDEAARSFPRLRLVIAAMGYPFVDQTLALLGKHEHVYADLSRVVERRGTLREVLVKAHEWGVADKLLFGSGFPWSSPAAAAEAILTSNGLDAHADRATTPPKVLRRIVERDALSCLGLTAPTTAPARRATQEDAPADLVPAQLTRTGPIAEKTS